MADSLLDFDYNNLINKALGTTNQPFSGLINDPNYNSSLNVDTLLGAGLGYANSLYKNKTVGEKALSTVTGAKSARTKAINDYVQNILTQQDYSKNVLDMTLNRGKIAKQPLELLQLQGKLEQQPYDLIKSRFEAESAPYKTGQEKNKFHESSLFLQGVKDEIKMLEDKGDLAGVNFIKAAPKEYFKKLSERDYKTQPMPDGYNTAAKSIGLDPNERATWKKQDWADLDNLIKAPDAKGAQDSNLKTQEANQLNPRGIPLDIVVSRDTIRKQINNRKNREKMMPKDYTETGGMSNSNGIVNASEQKNVQELENQSVYNSENIKFYIPSQEELKKGMIQKGTSEKFPEGAVFAPTGTNYTLDEWDSLGTAYKFALRPTRLPEKAAEIELATEANAESAGAQHEYLYQNIDRRQKAIAEILSNPKFIKDLTSLGGRAITNLDLGSYGFTSDVQDIQNVFDKVKNQTFITEIQAMRANNKTGGAVGNVSDKEVAMFQNIPAALMRGGSAKFLYTEIFNVYNQQKDLMRKSQSRYTGLYGQTKANEFGVADYNVEDYKEFLPYEEALKQAGFESFQDKQKTRIIDGMEIEKKRNVDRIMKREKI